MTEDVVGLLSHRNVEELAKAVGITADTLLRRMKVPELDKACREARRAAYSRATARLQQATGAAISTLLKIMVDAAAPPSVRARAADGVPDHAKQAIEIEDVEVRVATLEQAAELSKNTR